MTNLDLNLNKKHKVYWGGGGVNGRWYLCLRACCPLVYSRPLVSVAPHPGQTVYCKVSRNKMRLKKRRTFYIINILYIYIYIYITTPLSP